MKGSKLHNFLAGLVFGSAIAVAALTLPLPLAVVVGSALGAILYSV